MFKPKASASRRNVPKPIKPRQIVQEHQATSATTEKKEKTLTLKPASKHYGKQRPQP
jgi:hypothetical protein